MDLEKIIGFFSFKNKKAPKVLPILTEYDEIRAKLFPEEYGIKIDESNKDLGSHSPPAHLRYKCSRLAHP